MTRFYQTYSLRSLIGALLLVLTIAAGCTYSHGDPVAVVPCENATAALATYATVVSPIFERSCRECHGATVYTTLGNGKNFSTYQAIKNYVSTADGSRRLLGCIRQDPVQDAGYPPMPQDRDKLSACDIARIKAWLDADAPNN